MLSFGERLQRARKRKGWTQTQVMNQTNITDKSLSRYENGASAPDPATIATLCRLYDVSADYLLGLSPQMGHADSATAATAPDVHEKLEELSPDAHQKAEDYIAMLWTLERLEASVHDEPTRPLNFPIETP